MQHQSITPAIIVGRDPDFHEDSELLPTLPYGVWRMSDGSEVLFNRRYKAIWTRDAEKKNVRKLGGDMHVSDFSDLSYTERFFRADGVNNPRCSQAATDRCIKIEDTFIEGGNVRDFMLPKR
ncbi:hypothetical protein [uncultured Roseobacter sp.]|uniref:hypothetical protein n=1 Tax=uncultured Roseobacter sp. TaxID=114847 RepID=UPI00261CF08D|nr:hypothetical protein [uncultured Roseobacter sp.]